MMYTVKGKSYEDALLKICKYIYKKYKVSPKIITNLDVKKDKIKSVYIYYQRNENPIKKKLKIEMDVKKRIFRKTHEIEYKITIE